ncbi:MAG: hypothetical protein ACK4ML_16175 [Alishewanella aestuarii]
MIYKIDAVTPSRKRIKIGLAPIEGVEDIALILNLMDYYHKSAKRSKPNVFPSQLSRLSNEDYFKLSKIFYDNQLFTFVHRVCQSIIFSTASDCMSRLMNKSKAEYEESLRLQNGELEKFIRLKLTGLIRNSGSWSLKLEIEDLKTMTRGAIKKLALLKQFTIEQLTIELTYAVTNLVKHLRLFQAVYRVPFSIIDHQPKESMTMLTEVDDTTQRNLQGQSESNVPALLAFELRNGSKIGLRTDFVLTLLVPNLQHLNDCLVVKDELFNRYSMLKELST